MEVKWCPRLAHGTHTNTHIWCSRYFETTGDMHANMSVSSSCAGVVSDMNVCIHIICGKTSDVSGRCWDKEKTSSISYIHNHWPMLNLGAIKLEISDCFYQPRSQELSSKFGLICVMSFHRRRCHASFIFSTVRRPAVWRHRQGMCIYIYIYVYILRACVSNVSHSSSAHRVTSTGAHYLPPNTTDESYVLGFDSVSSNST